MTKLLSLARFGNAAVLAGVCGLVGCVADNNDADGMRARQDAALKDPFSYNPSTPGNGKAAPDPAMPEVDQSAKGEWGRFWNP